MKIQKIRANFISDPGRMRNETWLEITAPKRQRPGFFPSRIRNDVSEAESDPDRIRLGRSSKQTIPLWSGAVGQRIQLRSVSGGFFGGSGIDWWSPGPQYSAGSDD